MNSVLKVALFVLTITFTTVAIAQESEIPQKRSLEIFAGPSLVYNHSSEEFDRYGKAKLSYHFGINFRHRIFKRVDITTALGFSRKGYKTAFEDMLPPDIYNNPPTTNLPPERTEVMSNLNNDYLIVRLLLETSFFKRQLILATGLYGGKLIKSQLTVTESQKDRIVYKSINSLKYAYQDYDWGVSILISHEFKSVFLEDFGVQVGMDYGLMSVMVDNPTYQSRNNLVFNLFLTYKIL
ncbi:MAG: outer membrane beta-barrel protein [Fulvivirga sp.]